MKRIGNWEIIVNENGKRKSYDVIHVETSEIIASQLMLYEAACGLARALNEGNFINSTDVLGLLYAEQEYANSVSDMILYKHHLTKNKNRNSAGIYDTKYSEDKYLHKKKSNKIYLDFFFFLFFCLIFNFFFFFLQQTPKKKKKKTYFSFR